MSNKGQKIFFAKMAFLLLASCLRAASFMVDETEKVIKVTSAGTEMAVGKHDGVVELKELNGVTLGGDGGSARIAEPVFNVSQMERGAPALCWESEVRQVNGELVLSQMTVLREKAAGLDLDGVRLTRELTFSPPSPLVKVSFKLENPGTAGRYAAFGVRNDFAISTNGEDYCYVPHHQQHS